MNKSIAIIFEDEMLFTLFVIIIGLSLVLIVMYCIQSPFE